MQMPFSFMIPKAEWRPPVLSSLPSWKGARRVAVDLETDDPFLTTLGPGVRRGGRVVGISFAIEDGISTYLPIGHTEDNLDPDHVWSYLRDQSAAYEGDIVGANLGYDLDYLWQNRVTFPKVRRYRDVQVAATLVDELQMSYSLGNIAKRLELPGKNEELLRDAAKAWGVDPKKGMSKLAGRFVGPYAIHDVELPLMVLRRLERQIEEQGLDQVYDLETRLTPVLVTMRRRGVKIDQHHLQKVEDWSVQEQTKEHQKIFEHCGYRLGLEDIDKSRAKAEALKASGIENIPTTPKSRQPSVDKFFLDKHAKAGNPVAAAMLRASKVAKLRNTFVNSIRTHMVNGRIHCTFNQLRRASDSEGDDDTGARYGRLSCVDPNMQQMPARDPEIGKFWRTIFIADDGMIWGANDYSQQEPRLTYHYAALCGLPGAEAMCERFRKDLNADSHTEMTKMCYGDEAPKSPDFKKLRTYCKEIFLGVTYGMGGAKLCRKLNKPTMWKMSQSLGRQIEVAGPEGQAILDEVDRRMPFLKMLTKLCEKRAKQTGMIRTVLGRACHFPLKPGTKEFDWCHKALNRLIQGSAADMTKKAVVDAADAGWVVEDTSKPGIQLQVHDELDGSYADASQAEQVGDIMRAAVPLKLPCKVDVELGSSWGDSMG